MKITQLVNAMALLEGKKTRILFDPWVTSVKIRSRSDIYNFPEISMSAAEVAALAPDYIYISHTHPDHFDPDTLAHFPNTTPIIISWYEQNFTLRMVRDAGFTDVRVADPEMGLQLNGEDRCWLNPGTIYPETDSVAFFRIDGKVVCNFNDNPFEANYVQNAAAKYGPVDIAMIPFCGHGPYPMFYYNLTETELRVAAAKKRQKYYEEFVRFIDVLAPRIAIPFAGGVVCGGEKALRYVYSGLGTAQEAVEFAQRRAIVPFKPIMLSSFCSYDTDNDRRDGDFVQHTYEGEALYLQNLSKLSSRFDEGGAFYVARSERIDLTRLLTLARAKQKSWQDRRQISSRAAFFFDVGEELLYGLSLARPDIVRVREADIDEEFYEIFRLPYGLLLGLLTKHYNWSNVKTQYISYFRRPDRFDPDLHFLMNFLHI